jgi:cation diffusion facilitator family transporter
MGAGERKVAVAWLSVVSNTALVLLKIAVGVMIGSVSVISEAIHSGVDLLAAVIALFAVKTSGKSPDEEHPFGHGKVENLSGTVEAVLIFVAAGWIIYEAAHKLFKPQPIEAAAWGVGVMLISALVNILVSWRLFKIGRETESVALLADAWHLRTDVYTSLGVMAGLALLWAGNRLFPEANLNWLDPVAAIGVALLIIRAAYELTVQSARDLLDAHLHEEEIWIRKKVAGMNLPICGFHHLRTRKAGATRFVDVHLVVDREMTVEDSHQVSHEVVTAIQKQYPDCTVTVHTEPCDGGCPPQCLRGCLRSEAERLTARRNALGNGQRTGA